MNHKTSRKSISKVKSFLAQTLPIGLLLLFSLVATKPLWQEGIFASKDGELHLARIAAHTEALERGQFPVRWAARLNYSYGTPIFNFVYPLPYWVGSLFFFFGLNLFASLKMVLGLSLILSGVFMYMAMSLRFKDHWSGFIAGLVYMYAPYRFTDIYIRLALGEAVAFVFPPLFLYGCWLWQQEKRPVGWTLMSLATLGLVLSHNALALIFLGFFALFGLVMFSLRQFLLMLVAVALGLGAAAFFWIPALLELKYTLTSYYLVQKDFHDYFLTAAQLVTMEPGLAVRSATFIGLGGFIIVLMFTLGWVLRKIAFRPGLILLISWLASVFLTTRYSAFLWEAIPLLKFFQTPSRFLSLTIFLTGLMAGWIVASIRPQKLMYFLLTAVSVGFSLGLIRSYKLEERGEAFFTRYPKGTTWHNEGSPIWTAGEADRYPGADIKLNGKGLVERLHKSDLVHSLQIVAEEPIELVDNTVYFPGWRAFVDGQETNIQFQDPRNRGLIEIIVPEGRHEITIQFGRTKIRLLSEMLTLASLFGLVLLSTRKCFRKYLVKGVK